MKDHRVIELANAGVRKLTKELRPDKVGGIVRGNRIARMQHKQEQVENAFLSFQERDVRADKQREERRRKRACYKY